MNAHTKSFKTALLIAALAMPVAVNASPASDASKKIHDNPSNAKTIIIEAFSSSPDLATIIDIVKTSVKNNPTVADVITATAIAQSPDSAAAIISAAIGAAPSAAQAITKAAISIPNQNTTVTNAIIAASVSSVTELATKNSAVTSNTKSTESATASTDVLKEVILAEFNASCPNGKGTQECLAFAEKAVARAGASKDVSVINDVKAAVSLN